MKEQKEIWKDIPQFEGFLQASDHGRIREYILVLKPDNSVIVWKNRIINIINDSSGTNSANTFSYLSKRINANKAIYSAFFDVPTTYYKIRPKDGNNLNTRPDNMDCIELKPKIIKKYKAEDNYQAKLNNKQIYQLCLDFINGFSGKALAEKYNIHYMNVYRILRNKIWTSVTRPTVTRQIINKDDNKIKKFFEEKVNQNQLT